MVVFPSGIFNTRRICATVPSSKISLGPGFSTLWFCCATTPMILSAELESFIS